ncbi:MAG: hypothetical protein JXR76_07450 [Deltaproteobacteria bacterium]|nr:hypothetical protein [Deltaproteobacteria bacterium]
MAYGAVALTGGVNDENWDDILKDYSINFAVSVAVPIATNAIGIAAEALATAIQKKIEERAGMGNGYEHGYGEKEGDRIPSKPTDLDDPIYKTNVQSISYYDAEGKLIRRETPSTPTAVLSVLDKAVDESYVDAEGNIGACSNPAQKREVHVAVVR